MKNKSKWVGSFSVSPVNLTLTGLQFKNETIWTKVKMSIGGSLLRIKFSNLFGTLPLNIKEACIYRVGKKSSENFQKILFSGKKDISIPENKEVFSDIIDFEIMPLEELWIGIYIEEFTELTTGNFSDSMYYFSEKNNLLENFHFLDEIKKTEYQNLIIPFITNIDILTTSEHKAVIAFGDSLTAINNWTIYLMNKLRKNGIDNISVLRQGINGNRLIYDSIPIIKGLYGSSGLSRFERDALKQSGAGYIIIFLGINDLIHPFGSVLKNEKITSKKLIDSFKICIERAKEKKIKVIGATLMPFYGYKLFSEELERIRNEVNQWIRFSGEYDNIIDFDEIMRDPDEIKKLKKEYDSGDHLHPNDLGAKAMTNGINLELFN